MDSLRDCEDFMDHVEKTVCVGYIPEHKISMIVRDNSGDDPVQGYMRDVCNLHFGHSSGG